MSPQVHLHNLQNGATKNCFQVSLSYFAKLPYLDLLIQLHNCFQGPLSFFEQSDGFILRHPPSPKVLQHPLHPNAKNLPQIHLWFHVLVQMSRKYSPNAEPRFRANPCSTLSNTRGHIFGRILQIHRWAKRRHGHACKSSGMSNVRLRPKLAACNSGFARTRSFAEWNVAKLSRCLCPLLNPFLVQACSASGG